MSIEDFKEALSQWATGVTIVTTCWEGRNYGVTINSFTSLSLEPLLVLFGLQRQSSVHEIFCKAPFFAVTILSEKQAQLSELFTRPAQVQWSEIPFDMSAQKCPILRGGLVSLECRSFQNYAVGDNEIIIGHVVDVHNKNETKPLLYFKRKYKQLGD
ncbi:MAG: flavin reductase family protein [Alphaproteobacteria bacterium]